MKENAESPAENERIKAKTSRNNKNKRIFRKNAEIFSKYSQSNEKISKLFKVAKKF